MEKQWIEMLGFAAGFLTTFSAGPQLVYTYRTKDVKSINLVFMTMLVTGLTMWGGYGILIGSAPIVFFNFVGCALWIPIITMKIRDLHSSK